VATDHVRRVVGWDVAPRFGQDMVHNQNGEFSLHLTPLLRKVPVDTVIKKGLTSFIVLEATSKSVWFFSASSKSRFTDAGGAGSSCAMYDEAMLSALPWLSSILTTARFSFLRLKITSVLKVYLISNKPSAYLQCLGRFRILLLPDP